MGRISRLVGVVGLTAEEGEEFTVVAELRIVHIDGEIRIAVAVSKNVLPFGIALAVIAISIDFSVAHGILRVTFDTY